jgi:hypothetical protein
MRLSYDVETPLALSGESLRKRVAKPRGRIREGPEGVLIESGLLPLTDSLTLTQEHPRQMSRNSNKILY